MTKPVEIAIVYSTVSKMHRRTICDPDGAISIGIMPDGVTQAVICASTSSYHPLLPGESALIKTVPQALANPYKYTDWCDMIQSATGVSPPVIVCALIDAANVVRGVIMADPAVDAAPSGFTIVACSAKVFPGVTYDPKSGAFFYPPTSIPPSKPGNTTKNTISIPAIVVV